MSLKDGNYIRMPSSTYMVIPSIRCTSQSAVKILYIFLMGGGGEAKTTLLRKTVMFTMYQK
jgi:hypothetical protein